MQQRADVHNDKLSEVLQNVWKLIAVNDFFKYQEAFDLLLQLDIRQLGQADITAQEIYLSAKVMCLRVLSLQSSPHELQALELQLAACKLKQGQLVDAFNLLIYQGVWLSEANKDLYLLLQQQCLSMISERFRQPRVYSLLQNIWQLIEKGQFQQCLVYLDKCNTSITSSLLVDLCLMARLCCMSNLALDNADLLLSVAKAKIRVRQYRDALQFLLQPSILNPLQHRSYLWAKGNCLRNLNMFEEAITAYESMQDYHTDSGALRVLADCYRKLGELDETKNKIATELLEQRDCILLQKGNSYLLKNKIQEALKAFDRVIAHEKEALLGKARCFEAVAADEAALQSYKKLMIQYRDDPKAYFHYCRFLINRGYEGIDVCLEAAIKAWPNDHSFKELKIQKNIPTEQLVSYYSKLLSSPSTLFYAPRQASENPASPSTFLFHRP